MNIIRWLWRTLTFAPQREEIARLNALIREREAELARLKAEWNRRYEIQ